MSDADQPKKRRFHCNSCDKRTWHVPLWRDNKEYDGEEYEEWTIESAWRGLEVWECLGCEDALFLDSWSTSEDPEPEEHIYPERSVRTVKPKSYRGMSPVLGEIYEESIRAFNASCPVLCAAGLRALLEGICNDKGAMGRNLKVKIDQLSQWVPAHVLKNLHGFRFLGNQALHELDPPDVEDLVLAIEVIEDVMNGMYELDYKSGRLLQRLRQKKERSLGLGEVSTEIEQP